MKSRLFSASACMVILLVFDCGKNPAQPALRGCGQLQVWAHVAQQAQRADLAKTTATTWDSLVVMITATDMDTMTRAYKFDPVNAYFTATLSDVASGKARCVDVWTKNRKGLLIHAGARKKLDIGVGEIKTTDVTLIPKRGSIYIDITNIPVSVGGDSLAMIYAQFNWGAQSVSDSAKRGKSVFLALDNVPDSTAGILRMSGLSPALDTLYKSSCAFTFYALRDTTLSVKAATVSTGLSFAVTVISPGVTMVSASLDTAKTIASEHGPLIISEIMYAANDSEYIELYNPLSRDTVFDTIYIDIDGAYRAFTHVSVAARGFFVVGRKNLPWINAVHPVASALDLLSGGGNSIAVRAKDSSVMDWVAFLGSGNTQDWPAIGTAKKAIVLDSLVSDPTYNNYGKHWLAALTAINLADAKYQTPVTSQCGTPGLKGR